MGAFIDLTGKQFGRLIVKQRLDKRGKEWYWLCECECGNTKEVRGVSLREGKVKSCGCLKQETDRAPKGNVIDLAGQTFGLLKVIERAGSDNRGEALWECECECGQRRVVLGSNLRSGHTYSCGCERRSKGERAVEMLLKTNNLSFETEKIMFKYSNGYPAKFDFYVANSYLIEYDGETHYKSNLHGWHNETQLAQQQERDMIKNQWCKNNNIPLIRIPYTKLNSLAIEDLCTETTNFLI